MVKVTRADDTKREKALLCKPSNELLSQSVKRSEPAAPKDVVAFERPIPCLGSTQMMPRATSSATHL